MVAEEKEIARFDVDGVCALAASSVTNVGESDVILAARKVSADVGELVVSSFGFFSCCVWLVSLAKSIRHILQH